MRLTRIPITLRLGRYSLVAVVVLLAIALLFDVSTDLVGGLTADAYYLPLRAVPLGAGQRDEIETILIETHGRLVRHRRRIWFVLHGSALGCASLALAAVSRLSGEVYRPQIRRVG